MTKEWEEYKSILSEIEPYQKWAKKQNLRFKKATLTKGGQKNTSPYTKRPPLKSKSGLGPLEEEGRLVPEIKDELNPKIWSKDGELDQEVREKLLKIANDFYEKLDLPAPVLNITLTGSMANYNWTDMSDLDLHILIDYSEVDENTELVEKYLSEAKTNWNRNHEITMKDHEVEVYVQDSNEPHHSTGVFSLLDDQWIIKPVKKKFSVSQDDIKKKYESLKDSISMIEKLEKDKKYEEVYGDTDRLRSKIAAYRQSGLETGGEFSVENLVFKALRNGGELEKLSDLKRTAYDQMMTIEESSGKHT